jgi:site-specific DNA-methyltransferase (cytosine-N4-specific)
LPAIPAALIAELTSPGDTVLDPFAGSGTTLVEALRLGRHAIGVDINPLAVLISQVKCRALSTDDRTAVHVLVSWARNIVEGFYRQLRLPTDLPAQTVLNLREQYPRFAPESPCLIPDRDAVEKLALWFPAEALYEITLILGAVQQSSSRAVRELCLVALSSMITSVSYRESESRSRQVRREITRFTTLQRWARKVETLLDCVPVTDKLQSIATAELHRGDARNLAFLPGQSVDLVVTSPPYANTLDYGAHHRLRLLWLGLHSAWNPRDEIGSHRTYSRDRGAIGERQYEQEITEVMSAIRHALRHGKRCAVIIRSSFIRGALSKNVRCLIHAATSTGFTVESGPGEIASARGRLVANPRTPSHAEQLILLRRD